MPKYLAIFALFLGLAIYIACQDERAQESAQKAAHPNTGAAAAKADEHHPQENVYDTERHTPSWYGFFRWPNGTTAWAIILTLLVIAQQTKETARAAKAAQDSAKATQDSIPHQEKAAEAALLNAQAVINAERPWIVIKVVSPKPNHFILKAFNVGNTPAILTEFYFLNRRIRDGEAWELPVKSQQTSALLPPPPLLPARKSRALFPLEGQSGYRIIIWGEIHYRIPAEPTTAELHKTTWLYECYHTPDGFKIYPHFLHYDAHKYT
jgi:hypothetical protein